MVRADGVFEGIIGPEQFFRARESFWRVVRNFTDEEMLEKLRGLLSQHGQISGILIDEIDGFPSSAAFRCRFGSLISAYRLIGYDPQIDYSFIEINRRLRKQHPEIVASVIQKIESLGASAAWDESSESLWLNDELRVSIILCRHTTTLAGSSRWLIRLDTGLKPDITIAVRMDATNEGIRDYYLLPGIDMTWENLRVAEENGFYLDAYRFETLDYFFSLTQRIKNPGGRMNEEVKMIPIEQIRILNPRHRDKKKFEIDCPKHQETWGLKKPIQVSLRAADEAEGEATTRFSGRDASKHSWHSASRKFRRLSCKLAKKTGSCAAWWRTWPAVALADGVDQRNSSSKKTRL